MDHQSLKKKKKEFELPSNSILIRQTVEPTVFVDPEDGRWHKRQAIAFTVENDTLQPLCKRYNKKRLLDSDVSHQVICSEQSLKGRVLQCHNVNHKEDHWWSEEKKKTLLNFQTNVNSLWIWASRSLQIKARTANVSWDWSQILLYQYYFHTQPVHTLYENPWNQIDRWIDGMVLKSLWIEL